MSVLYGVKSLVPSAVSGRVISFASMNTDAGLAVSDFPVKRGVVTLPTRKSGPALYASGGGRLKYVTPLDFIYPLNGSVIEDLVDESLVFLDSLDVYCSSDSPYPSAPNFLLDANAVTGIADGAEVASYTCPFSGIVMSKPSSYGPTFVKSSQGGLPALATINGQCLYADGLPFSFPTGEFTIFAVMKIATINLYDGVICFSAVGAQDYSDVNGFTLEKCSTTNALRCTHRAGQSFEYEMAFPYNQFALFTWVRSSALASTVAYKGLGVQIGSGTGTVSSAINSTRMAIAARVNPSDVSPANSQTFFSELAVFNRSLSAAEILAAQQALTIKYGL